MILVAMDRASVRSLDANGFMHVEVSNISKANICPYYGSEIPGWDALGLEPDRVYQLYRDPEELAKAAPTFNNLPILSRHVPVDSHELPKELIIGSTGTDAIFEAPYLRNSLVIWPDDYQQAIIDGRQKELSSAYQFTADMTAREVDGLFVDGVMRDIIGNHVALVIEGRAGPDVVVGDDIMKLKSRMALMISGAVAAHVRPKLAKDAKVDLSAVFGGVSAATLAQDGAPKRIADKLVEIVKPHLAADAGMDVDEVCKVIGAVQGVPIEDDMIPDEPAMDDEGEAGRVAKLLEFLRGKLSEEDFSTASGMVATEEAADAAMEDDDDDAKKAPAMDAAAIKAAIKAAEDRSVARVAALAVARNEVKPHIGDVVGDSAEQVYKLALDAAGVDVKGVHPSAYRALVGMLKRPGTEKPVYAQDSAEPKLDKALPKLPPVRSI